MVTPLGKVRAMGSGGSKYFKELLTTVQTCHGTSGTTTNYSMWKLWKICGKSL
ncbi:hypothetical protein [Fischerella sp. FACHB-380]|uniref:hypothetical protein n=1 Tax=Fischerella sp. FACHB-380 TaxID=2692799 RepID=UPI001A7EF900|nr:hypothetical protein [Fischerella sp. FACHB-380]